MDYTFFPKAISFKFFLLTLLSLTLAGCNSSDKTYVEYLNDSKAYIKSKEPKNAEISLKNAIQKSPKTAEPRYLLGKLYLDSGNTPLAAVELRKAAQLGANTPEVYEALGKSFLLTGDAESILKQFDITPQDTDILKAIKDSFSGEALLSKRLTSEAKAKFEQALQFDPNNLRAQLGLAKVAVINNQTENAFTQVEAATTKHGEEPSLWITKADLYRADKQTDKAIESFEKALALAEHKETDTTYIAVRNLAYEYLHQMDISNAKAALEKIPKQYKRQSANDPMVNYVRAFAAFEEKDLVKAKEYADRVLPTSSFPFILLLLGDINLQTNKFEQAESQLTSFLERYPNHPTGNKLLALSQIKLNNLDSASITLAKLIEDGNSHDDISNLTLLANINLRSGNAEESEKYFKMALEKEPNNDSLKFGLAQSFFSQHNSEEAIKQLTSIPAGSKNHILASLAIAEALSKEGKVEQALQEIDSLPELVANSVIVPSFKGSIYLNNKQVDTAEQFFTAALKINPDYLPAIQQLAYIDSFKGNNEAVLERLEQANSITPQNYALKLDYAKALFQSNEIEKAIKALNDAILIKPESDTARLLLSQLELSINKPVAALAQLNLLNAPNTPQAQMLMGKARFAIGEYLTALDSFRRSEELKSSPTIAIMVYEVLIKLGNKSEAREYLHTKANQFYLSEPLILLAINDSFNNADLPEADRLISKLEANAPMSKALPFFKAKRLFSAPFEDAEQGLQEAFSKTTHIAYADALINLYTKNKQQDKAIDFAENNLNDPEKNAFFYTSLGGLHLANNDIKSALKAYDQALLKDPNNIIALNNSAWMLKDTDKDKAKTLIDRALKIAPENKDIIDTAREINQ